MIFSEPLGYRLQASEPLSGLMQLQRQLLDKAVVRRRLVAQPVQRPSVRQVSVALAKAQHRHRSSAPWRHLLAPQHPRCLGAHQHSRSAHQEPLLQRLVLPPRQPLPLHLHQLLAVNHLLNPHRPSTLGEALVRVQTIRLVVGYAAPVLCPQSCSTGPSSLVCMRRAVQQYKASIWIHWFTIRCHLITLWWHTGCPIRFHDSVVRRHG